MNIPPSLAHGCHVSLRLAGWLTVTLLAVLGCYVVAFLLIAGFDPLLFFKHVDNLAARFIAADAARRAGFSSLLVQSAVVLFAIIAVARRGSLLSIVHDRKEA